MSNRDFWFYTEEDGNYHDDVMAALADHNLTWDDVLFYSCKKKGAYPEVGEDWPEGTVLCLVRVT